MRTLRCSAHDVAGLASAITARGRPLRFVVRGASMAPTLRTGDRVVVAPVAPEMLARDDIVMIDDVRPRIHRVVHVDRDAGVVVTRGDALEEADPPASLSAVVGRLVGVERPPVARARLLLSRWWRRVARAGAIRPATS